MMRSCRALAFLALLLACTPAHAAGEKLSAGDLLRQCTGKSDLDYGFCAGYVTAIADALTISGQGLCNSGAMRSQQYIDLFTSYAELFPDKMSGDAETAVAAALARAFPCGK